MSRQRAALGLDGLVETRRDLADPPQESYRVTSVIGMLRRR